MRRDVLIHGSGEQPSWPSLAVAATVEPLTVAAVATVGSPVVSVSVGAGFGAGFGERFGG